MNAPAPPTVQVELTDYSALAGVALARQSRTIAKAGGRAGERPTGMEGDESDDDADETTPASASAARYLGGGGGSSRYGVVVAERCEAPF